MLEKAYKAGQEVGDLVLLVRDEISNKDQIADFAKEAFEAVTALAGVGIPKEKKEAVGRWLVEGILNKMNSKDIEG